MWISNLLVPLVSAVIFATFLGTSHSQNTTTGPEVIDPSANQSEVVGGEEEGSGDVDSSTLSPTTEPEEEDERPHLVVLDSSGKPCLLATLNATMEVSYRVPEGIVHETYLAMAQIQLPEDVNAYGVCGENTSRLFLEWGNGTFFTNFTFTRQEAAESENATWSLTGISISYDLSNNSVFSGASETEVVTVERHDQSLFKTEVGSTHVCDNHVQVQVGNNERGVKVNFYEVRLAAFGVTSSEFPPTEVYCPKQTDQREDEDIVVPLIVACCLSAVVIIVVIAYIITRKVQDAREQSSYKQMP